MDDRSRKEAPAGSGSAANAPEMPEELRVQLEMIRRMDPEMKDLGAILRSDAGEKFRDYVSRGLDFVDAYTLAAREKLQTLRDRRTEAALRAGEAGKRHLAATSARGEGSVSVPPEELEMIRRLNPDASDAEIRRYYSADRKRRSIPGK